MRFSRKARWLPVVLTTYPRRPTVDRMPDLPTRVSHQLRGAVGLLFGTFLIAYAGTGLLFPHPLGGRLPAESDLPFILIAMALLAVGAILTGPWFWSAAFRQEPPERARWAFIGLAAFAALFGMALALAISSPLLVVLAASGGIVLTGGGLLARIRRGE